MSMTKAEKLISQDGQTVECEICGREKQFNRHTWLMTFKKEAVCPACQASVARSGMGMISI